MFCISHHHCAGSEICLPFFFFWFPHPVTLPKNRWKVCPLDFWTRPLLLWPRLPGPSCLQVTSLHPPPFPILLVSLRPRTLAILPPSQRLWTPGPSGARWRISTMKPARWKGYTSLYLAHLRGRSPSLVSHRPVDFPEQPATQSAMGTHLTFKCRNKFKC